MSCSPVASRRDIYRRDFLGANAGAAAVAAGIARTAFAQAQVQPPPEAPAPLPTKAVIVARQPGGIRAIGLNRPEAENRLDPAMLFTIKCS